MPNNVVHFAIHADDPERARNFYEAVFGWQFEAWGPTDFWLIKTGTEANPGIHGALQRRTKPVQGDGMNGYECTISVESVDDVAAAVEKNGGSLLLQKTHVPTVGWMIQLRDTEGNTVNAMKYERGNLR